MKRSVIKNVICTMIIGAISFAITACVYHIIPAQVSMLGDKTYDKNYFVWLLPTLSILVGLILSFLPLLYQKILKDISNVSYNSTGNIISMTCAVLLFMQIVFVCSWLDYTIAIWNVAIAAFGFLIILVGNYMPRFKRNSFIAIYNPWTLASKIVWQKTHRFGGYAWIIGGIAIIFMILVPNFYNLWIVLALFVLVLIIPNIYSFIYYQILVKKN